MALKYPAIAGECIKAAVTGDEGIDADVGWCLIGEYVATVIGFLQAQGK